jgi:hypothetical protein
MLTTPEQIAAALRELAGKIVGHDEIMQSLLDQAAEMEMEEIDD